MGNGLVIVDMDDGFKGVKCKRYEQEVRTAAYLRTSTLGLRKRCVRTYGIISFDSEPSNPCYLRWNENVRKQRKHQHPSSPHTFLVYPE